VDHHSFLCQTLWKFQKSNLFTDVTIVCSDGEVPVHKTMLVSILQLWEIKLEELEAEFESLVIPEVTADNIKDAMKSIYLHWDTSKLFSLFCSGELFNEGDTKIPEKQSENNQCEDFYDLYDAIKEEPTSSEEKIIEEHVTENEKAIFEPTIVKRKRGRPKGKRDMTKRKICTFQCEDCDLQLKGRMKYKKHLRKYHGLEETKTVQMNVPTSCQYCEKGFANIYNYNAHIALIHREKAYLHPEIEFKKQCQECDEKFYGILDLNKHSLSIHGKSVRTFKCNFCGEKLFSSRSLKDHRLSQHKEELTKSGLTGYGKNVLCPYCSDLFTRKSYISRHIYKKHGDKLHQHPEIKIKHSCKLCGEKFISKDDLQDHNAVNHGEEFQCDFCERTFKHKASRRSHIAEHHKNEKHMCEQCPKIFNTKVAVQTHLRKTHAKQPYKFPCTHCSKGAMTEEGLQKHIIKMHEIKQFMCSFCPDTFHENKNRQLHEARMHSERTVPCDQCEKMFPDLNILNFHVQNVHVMKKPKICPICDKACTDDNVYKCHMNRHNGLRPYACETCGNSYHTNRDLKKHQSVHTLPYKCIICEKCFSAKGILDDHVRKHRGEKLDCRHLCGSSYLDRRSRDRHEKSCVNNPEKGSSWSSCYKIQEK